MNRYQAFLYRLARKSKGAHFTFSIPFEGEYANQRSWFAIFGAAATAIAGAFGYGAFNALGLSGEISGGSFLLLVGSTFALTAAFLNALLKGFTVLVPTTALKVHREASVVTAEIARISHHRLLKEDKDALVLAHQSCKLFDDFAISLQDLALADIRSSRSEFEEGNRELLATIDTLKEVKDHLSSLLAEAEKAETLELLRSKDIRLAREDVSNSLKNIQLRDAIREGSLKELDRHLKPFEGIGQM